MLELLPKASVGAEIGVHLGDFSAHIVNVVSPSELHLIDPWQHQTGEQYKQAWYGGTATGGQVELDERYEAVCRRFADKVNDQTISIHRGCSEEVLSGFPDGYFDWVYIDGNHLYEYVTKDLYLSLKKVKTGGLITGDDYMDGGWWDGGAKKAVDEFKRNPEVDLIELQNHQYVFRKK